jgi:UDP-2,3-diacylglucosamine hydrolase
MKAYFLSDLHLKSMQERNSQTLLRFLHSVRDEQLAINGTKDQGLRAIKGASDRHYVFLVGDIFDLWIGKHDYFVSRFKPIVDAIAELVRAGVEVHYFEGNHDLI